MFFCKSCKIYVSKLSSHYRSNIHKSNRLSNSEIDNVQVIASAFKKRIISYKINPIVFTITPETFLSQISNTVYNTIKKSLKEHKAIKVNFELFVSYILPKNDEISMKSFNTKFNIIVQSTDIADIYRKCSEKLTSKCSEFELSDSGWTINFISHLEVNINKYNPLRAGTYLQLPTVIRNTKSCLNIRNNDNYCFLWCLSAHMYPTVQNPNRTKSYPHYTKLFNLNNLSYPPNFNDIKIFEMNNPFISVNVYGLDSNNHVTGPLYLTCKRKLIHANLLYIFQNGKAHFCLIKDFSRLLHRQLTKHKSKVFLCDECFLYYGTINKLMNHNCGRKQTILPEEHSKLHFVNFERTQSIPIVIYGDFESLLCEYSDKNKSIFTESVQAHKASSFAYYICCKAKPDLNEFVSYRGPNCSQTFVKTIINDVKRLHNILQEDRPMLPLTPEELTVHNEATTCHICKTQFVKNDKIVKDHDHFTGKYRGPAHNNCNLNFKKCQFIPIIFHNLSGYDSHLFIKELSGILGRINLIPKSKEKYISFTKFIPIDKTNTAQLKFIDSFNFLSTSLDKLAKTLHSNDFHHMQLYFPNENLFQLVRRKGVYCYDYIDTWEKYNETQLPERSKFFNKLTGEHISTDDYQHAKKVWDSFKIKNLGEYTDLYLKCDVLLLCDIFEKFRDMSLNYYSLDPCFYVSSPSLSWDAMLLHTKVELELISDVDMYQMLEDGIRGGLAQCSLRYAKANNKYLSSYNNKEPSSYLIYLDCVNLYGFAMMQKLPMRNFKFMNENEIVNFNVMNVSKKSKQGYILEVDLHYPTSIHNSHSDLPFAAEKFSPLQRQCKKLIANLYNKYRFVIHYLHLQECLKNGLILLKIHRILTFFQDNFLEPYISLNTSLRQKAKSDFERDFFKKQNNSIFGKTIENKRKQLDVRLVQVWKDKLNTTNKLHGAEKYISAPNFKDLTILDKNLVAIQLNKTKVVLDRPIYIGFSILEISKTHLYNFHYSVMKKIYGDNIKLCYTDTDSLLYHIKTDDFYTDMKNNITYFDTSNFVENNIYVCQKLTCNYRVISKTKWEEM
ncbi:unnamed protein product [Spodoptera littoralis]|uniref:DNA-directed DNA polymerase n=1 Tax=Spodoptera littoralis TaxID=7109 RepID=A0A9P0I4Z6_SPOLI|nr:unnamed protein product [Spodoptera littoralis]